MALTNRRPADRPLRQLQDNALEAMTTEAHRTINSNGIVRWDNVNYTVDGWQDRKVIAYRAADGAGDIVVEDKLTGERRPGRRYTPRPYGEVRTGPATPLEQLRSEDTAVEHGSVDVYAPDPSPVVVPLPARTAPSGPVETPLDAGRRFRNITEAMVHLVSLYPYKLTADDHATAKEYIENNGLDRQKVDEIAGVLLRRRKLA